MKVTKKMAAAGNRMASDLTNAAIASSMGKLGGNPGWEGFVEQYKGENMDLITQYISKEIDAVTAIYTAMHRAKKPKEVLYDVCNDYSLDPATKMPDESEYTITDRFGGKLYTHTEYGEIHYFKGPAGLTGKKLRSLG